MTTFNIPLSVNADDVRDALVEFMKALGLDHESHWAVDQPITIHPLDEGFTISAGLVLTDDEGEIIEHNGDPVSIPVNYIAEEDDADKWEDCPVCGDDDEDSAFCACDDDEPIHQRIRFEDTHPDDYVRPARDEWVDGHISLRGFAAGLDVINDDIMRAAQASAVDVDDLIMKHTRITEAPTVINSGVIDLEIAVDEKSLLADIKKQIEERQKNDQAAYVLQSWIREVEAQHFPGDILLISETKSSAWDIVKAMSSVDGGENVCGMLGVLDEFLIAGRTVHIEDLQGLDDAAVEAAITRGRTISTVLIDGRADLPEGLLHQLLYRTPAVYSVTI